MSAADLLIRNVEINGAPKQDVRVADGRIVEIGARLTGGDDDIDGHGGALLPGLIDHHTHLFALAAVSASVNLAGLRGAGALASALRARDGVSPPGAWLRGVGYHEAIAGVLDRRALDAIIPERPVRIQHAGGALWMLNSAALARVVTGAPTPAAVERDDFGAATGRIWRGDDWLRARIADDPPSLATVSAELARFGVTGVADASVYNDAAQFALFEGAHARGELLQRVLVMSGGALETSNFDAILVGPVKVLLDDDALPDLEQVGATIRQAHVWGRAVAVHCVTAGELAFALAAFTQAGCVRGDRIEHGGVVHHAAAAEIAALRLTVVTQPGFVKTRGDRYLAEVDAADQAFLYPCASLLRAGVKVAGSTDAPYGEADPWAAMASAVSRTTNAGRSIGAAERIDADRALGLFLGDFQDPGGPSRTVRVGAPADLCVLDAPLKQVLSRLDGGAVTATIASGRVIHSVL